MNIISVVPSPSLGSPDFFNFLHKRQREGRVTVREDRQNYLVSMDLPGFIKDDININFSRGILNIYASSYVIGPSYRAARSLGRRHIHKSVKIAGKVDEDHISYLYEDKTLRIWLPKKDTKKMSFSRFPRGKEVVWRKLRSWFLQG
ncbi:MAG: Hsp20 family protein [Deltaproteobacteria bacterium]|nr:Hsp20 family protein [Deltaproteobacteria bacterium]